MKAHTLILLGLLCLVSIPRIQAEETISIISYNVENLFDATADSTGIDAAYTPTGERHWTYSKYQNKLRHVAQVITNIGGWQTPALVGLMEVENAKCLHDLTRYTMPNHGYRYLHQNSPDERGIDCALLYHPKQFTLIDSAFIAIPLEGRATRDILYAKGAIGKHKQDTLHVFVCHMPSQLGGASNTNIRREKAFAVLQMQIDSILTTEAQANIIVMGDMNQEPQNNVQGMQNRMVDFSAPYPGTHKYSGIWSFLDQVYTAGGLLDKVIVSLFAPKWLLEDDPKFGDKRPIRTYHGFRYQAAGYSDHLPIVITLHNR